MRIRNIYVRKLANPEFLNLATTSMAEQERSP
jgi:hypothetical protein